jgi:hypothetical protein
MLGTAAFTLVGIEAFLQLASRLGALPSVMHRLVAASKLEENQTMTN